MDTTEDAARLGRKSSQFSELVGLGGPDLGGKRSCAQAMRTNRMISLRSQGISHRVSCIVGTGDACAAWAHDRKQCSFTTERYGRLQDYESSNRCVFAVPADCWGVSRRTARSTCSQTAVQSEQFGLRASSPCTCYIEEPCIRLCGPRPSFSGQFLFVWTGFRK
jgi:hypothetical protein